MRALEKDRTGRYATPTELAADIQRHLNHELVLACLPSVSYRLGTSFASTECQWPSPRRC